MISTLFGILVIISAVLFVVFVISTIIRFIQKKNTMRLKYAIALSFIIAIASFIGFGITYETQNVLTGKGMQEDEINIAQESSENKEVKTFEDNNAEDGIDYQSEAPAQTLVTPEKSPETDLSGTLEQSEAPTTPEYETTPEDMKEKIISNVKEAIDGRFDTDKTPVVIFDPFSGTVSIEARAADNFTNSWIRKGIASDIADTLQRISLNEKGFNYEVDGEGTLVYGIEKVIFIITFPLMDAKGNEIESTVVSANYTRKTLEDIAWKNKNSIDFEEIADKYWVSPALE